MRLPRIHDLTLASLLVLTATSCGGGGGSDSSNPPPPGGGGPAGQPSTSTNGTIRGLVSDQTGTPLRDVAISVGSGTTSRTARTNEQGFFAVNDVTPGNRVVRYTRDGYVENFKQIEVRESQQSQVSITLQSAGTTQTIDATRPATVTHRGGKVELPANGIVDDQGRAVSDCVVQITTMTPGDPGYSFAMPGEFEGIDAGVTTRLLSFGILDVELRDSNGQDLQLAPGATATLEFPIPPNDQGDATLPLWWANPETGVWEREGSATRLGSQGVYRGTVSHFTPWNIDKGPPTATKLVRLRYRGVPAVGVTVRVVGIGWMAGGVTDTNGEVRLPVTANVTGRPSFADILMLQSDGRWIVLRSQEQMPGFQETLLNEYDETDGVTQVAGSIILRWGERPTDLDTHLTIPTQGSRYHLYYARQGSLFGSPWAALDTDDVTSFGPEITTISEALPGRYRYCVHNFSRNTQHPITDSGATVTLVLPGQPTRVYPVPADNPQSLNYWAVFDLTFDANGNASVTDLNQFGDSNILDR